jgi:hypothetical protein
MRRKILQDLANTVCQNYIDLSGGFDAAVFACYGSGTALMNFLSGECTFNCKPIPALKSSAVLREWLHQRFAAHNIAVQKVALAQMTVTVGVSNLKFRRSYGHAFFSGCFYFDCESKIRTDERAYHGQMSGEKIWGFGEDYDAGCGEPQFG